MNTQTLLSIVADQREELLANDYSELCPRPEESQLDLKSNRAQVVIGVRRCGKSTLCEMFLKQKGIDFAYVNFDDDRMEDMKASDLDHLLEALYMTYGEFKYLNDMAEFDQYGRLKNNNYRPQPLSSFTSTYVPSSSSYGRPNIWNRFNSFIEDIGEWLRDNTEALSNNIAIGVFFLACAVAIIGAIVVWIDEGFWSFVGYAIIGYLAMYYGGLIITGIMMYVLRIPIFILGLIFYNAYVLLITIAISLGVLFYNVNDWSFQPKEPRVVNTTTNIPTTTRYKCTANTFLNVRKSPNSSSQIIGTIQRNAIVDVYDISNGFAKIKYNNSYAYISVQYITKYYN